MAFYRAQESARPDALFKDPLAQRLAGERGRAIAAKVPRQARSGWPMVTRTKLIDDLVMASVADGCDCVLNIAAGLDTRPYRLALPETLSWIEADLPPLVAEKNEILRGEKPACRLTREGVDILDATQRRTLLDRVAREAKRVLLMTEGLLAYLEDAEVRTLARDFASRPAIAWWILDMASPAIRDMMNKGMGDTLAKAPLKFAPPNGVAFFEELGWKPREIESMFRSAVRLKRVPLMLRIFALFPEPNPRNPGNNRWGAIIRFEPAKSSG